MKLPPFGVQYASNRPAAGVVVACGQHAWAFAKSRTFPCMVLECGTEPAEIDWPSNGRAALIHETGEPNELVLGELARALVVAGAPSVVVIRHSYLDADPRIFFGVEYADDAA